MPGTLQQAEHLHNDEVAIHVIGYDRVTVSQIQDIATPMTNWGRGPNPYVHLLSDNGRNSELISDAILQTMCDKSFP